MYKRKINSARFGHRYNVFNPEAEEERMKKLITTLMVGSALVLSACASTDTQSDYGYETQAPYASERTVGSQTEPQQAERVFQQRQRK